MGDKPLIVRKAFAKDSEQLGRLLPGQMVTIIEERISDDGEVRACISLDSISMTIDGIMSSASSYRSSVGSSRSPNIAASSHQGGVGSLESVGASSARNTEPSSLRSCCTSLDSQPGPHHAHRPHSEPQRSMHRPITSIAEQPSHEPNHEPSSRALASGGTENGRVSDDVADASLEREHRSTVDGEAQDFLWSHRTNPGSDPSSYHHRDTSIDRSASTHQTDSLADRPLSGHARALQSNKMLKISALDNNQLLTPKVGWVTLVKDGRKLVSSRVKLGPGSRRQYSQQWERRKANDSIANGKVHPSPPSSILTSS